MATSEAISRARSNGHSSGQYVQTLGINAKRVVDALVSSSAPSRHAAIRRQANALLEKMSEHHWVVSAGPHQGGYGGDRTMHVTVRVDGTPGAYHLRLDSRWHLFQITGPDMPGPKPWVAPGS